MTHNYLFKTRLQKTSLLTAFLLLFFQGIVKAELVDRIVAVVNDDTITLSELEENGKDFLQKVRDTTPSEELDTAIEEARKRVLAKLIDQHLVSQQAVKANIRLSDQEFEDKYNLKLQQINLSREAFIKKLEDSGLTEKEYKEDFYNQLLRDKLILYEVRSKVIITDEMIEEYYKDKYANEIKDGGYHLLQIGVSWGTPDELQHSPGRMLEDKERARRQAVKIRQELLDGADFAAVARKESDLPSADDGGDVGVFQEDDLAPYMRDAILSLHTGEFTPILETPNGFQIFKLISHQQGDVVEQVPSDSIKEEIRKKLFERKLNEEYKNWVKDIKKNSFVKVML